MADITLDTPETARTYLMAALDRLKPGEKLSPGMALRREKPRRC